MTRMMTVKMSWRPSAAWKRSECSTSWNQFDAVEEEDVVAEGLLHRIVHHGHQRDDGVEGHQQQHRQHHEPGFVVPGLVHGSASHLDAPGIGVDVDALRIEGDRAARPGSPRPRRRSTAMSRPSRLARTILWRPISSTLRDRDRHARARRAAHIPAGCRVRSSPRRRLRARPAARSSGCRAARCRRRTATGMTFMPGEPMK